jgi:nucleoid DNA-binding protein
MTKTEFISALLNKNPHLTKAQIVGFLDSLAVIVTTNLKALGEASVPGIVKLKAVKKAATPERQGINPFTKQPVTIAAKPASMKVKAAPAKALKDAVV